MVLAVFAGNTSNCRGYTAESIREEGGRIIVRVFAHTYQSDEDTPSTQPWGVLVLPRSDKEVVLERDVRSLLSEPPRWKEWIAFPKISERKP
jgi:hypothetical protein